MSVPDRIHISWENLLARYTLASDVAAEAAYPLANLANKHRSHWAAWDMTAATSVSITGSSAEERAANCWAIHNHDAPRGSTIRVRLYDGEGQGGNVVYDSGAVDVRNTVPLGSIIAAVDPLGSAFEDEGGLTVHVSRFFDGVMFKSFQIDIENPDGFAADLLRVDKLWLGVAWCPRYGIGHGWQSRLIDDSEHMQKPGGGMETVEGAVRRSLRVSFEAASLPNSERHIIRHALDRAKMSGDLLVTLDPNDARSQRYETSSIYRRTNGMTFTSAFFNGNAFSLDLEEN